MHQKVVMVGVYLIKVLQVSDYCIKKVSPPTNWQAQSLSHVVTTCRLCSHVGGRLQLFTDLSLLSIPGPF